MISDKIFLLSADASMTHIVTSCLREAGYVVVYATHDVGALFTSIFT
jgi:hypothetical protein